MEFTRIQDAKTHEIIQYRLDGQRVTKTKYLALIRKAFITENGSTNYMNSYTTRTPKGNYKHTYSSNF